MAPVLDSIYDWHTAGTLFGIKVDPSDGLLSQGVDGVQLTWMDAKIGDWVVTPRHGKPVEINALWINALRVMEWLARNLEAAGHETTMKWPPEQYSKNADLATSSFNLKFWHEGLGHFMDTVDPDDASLRPNQVIAMALPFSPITKETGSQALGIVARELLTPVGLRTLGREEPWYRGKYKGPMAELDASYHQGTAWPWLLGSYASAVVRLLGDRQEAKRVLRNAKDMLGEYGLGGIAEVYDGDAPQFPGGCPWQAWSVAEFLRAWSEDIQGE
jgi:predicted glycogen debranching enzyme